MPFLPFASSEHEFLASGLSNPSLKLTLSNGLKVTFGQIIALAGDYYGVANQPICLGETPLDKEERFRAAFDELDHAQPENIKELIAIFADERKDIDYALRHGGKEADVLNQRSAADTEKFMECTNANYLLLAEKNLDHFGRSAELAYQAGHHLALKTAYEASVHTANDVRQRKFARALAYEAFACHFLTDRFAAGHSRTPRKELHDQFGPDIGSLLSLFQHNEDGDQGLNMKNKNGDYWKAYGDGHLFESYSEDNLAKVKEAVEAAVREVEQTFESGNLPNEDELNISNLLPTATDDNFNAMFIVNEKNQIFYRANINDIKCNEYKPLTYLEIFKILEQHAVKYADDSAVLKKIDAVKNDIQHDILSETEESSSCFSGIFTLFKPSREKYQSLSTNKTSSCLLM